MLPPPFHSMSPSLLAVFSLPVIVLLGTIFGGIGYAVYRDAQGREVGPPELWGVLLPSLLAAGVVPGIVAGIGYLVVR
ncbi:hypothetical protein [Halapricum salinum]|uniref:Uncharacterized protein n=1 Tax=Halapricum salinum TaxID=1457250 RepID=A0A4D6H9V0_9EURY|nr:hypothetical protein [Halapricum salinum]QCC50743.1 hypothetical protein DV733_05570 [Halapricum salinum]